MKHYGITIHDRGRLVRFEEELVAPEWHQVANDPFVTRKRLIALAGRSVGGAEDDDSGRALWVVR